jgi:hypothetical protein
MQGTAQVKDMPAHQQPALSTAKAVPSSSAASSKHCAVGHGEQLLAMHTPNHWAYPLGTASSTASLLLAACRSANHAGRHRLSLSWALRCSKVSLHNLIKSIMLSQKDVATKLWLCCNCRFIMNFSLAESYRQQIKVWPDRSCQTAQIQAWPYCQVDSYRTARRDSGQTGQDAAVTTTVF